MEITDSSTTELVTWVGIAGSVGIIDSWYSSQNNIKVIYDLNGKIVRNFESNNFYIVQYEDNSIGKIFVNEQ